MTISMFQQKIFPQLCSVAVCSYIVHVVKTMSTSWDVLIKLKASVVVTIFLCKPVCSGMTFSITKAECCENVQHAGLLFFLRTITIHFRTLCYYGNTISVFACVQARMGPTKFANQTNLRLAKNLCGSPT